MLRMHPGDRVLHRFARDGDVLHAKLFSIVAGWGAAQREQEHLSQPCLFATHARCNARPVMIAQDPVGPGSLGESRFVALDGLTNGACLPRRQAHELEIEGQVDLIELLAVVWHQTLYRQVQFANEHALTIVLAQCSHLLHDDMHTWLIYNVVFMQASIGRIASLPLWIHRIITDLLIFE